MRMKLYLLKVWAIQSFSLIVGKLYLIRFRAFRMTAVVAKLRHIGTAEDVRVLLLHIYYVCLCAALTLHVISVYLTLWTTLQVDWVTWIFFNLLWNDWFVYVLLRLTTPPMRSLLLYICIWLNAIVVFCQGASLLAELLWRAQSTIEDADFHLHFLKQLVFCRFFARIYLDFLYLYGWFLRVWRALFAICGNWGTVAFWSFCYFC